MRNEISATGARHQDADQPAEQHRRLLQALGELPRKVLQLQPQRLLPRSLRQLLRGHPRKEGRQQKLKTTRPQPLPHQHPFPRRRARDQNLKFLQEKIKIHHGRRPPLRLQVPVLQSRTRPQPRQQGRTRFRLRQNQSRSATNLIISRSNYELFSIPPRGKEKEPHPLLKNPLQLLQIVLHHLSRLLWRLQLQLLPQGQLPH